MAEFAGAAAVCYVRPWGWLNTTSISAINIVGLVGRGGGRRLGPPAAQQVMPHRDAENARLQAATERGP